VKFKIFTLDLESAIQNTAKYEVTKKFARNISF